MEGSKLLKGRVSLRRLIPLAIDLYLDRVNFILIDATLSVRIKPQRHIFSLATTKRYTTIHIPPRPISISTFSDTHLSKILCKQLRNKRPQLETNFVAEDEPFVLVHGDFHGRNIIMQGSQVHIL